MDHVVVRSDTSIEGEVVVLEREGEAKESWVENSQGLEKEFLAGLVAVADDDGRR